MYERERERREMTPKRRRAAARSSVHDVVDFRNPLDDAWYSVCLGSEGEGSVLVVKYLDFKESLFDEKHPAEKFVELRDVDEFAERFRPVSLQAQDSDCPAIVEGTVVCASVRIGVDLRFYDAVIASANHMIHGNWDGACSCTFEISWLHGPNEGERMPTGIDSLCLLQNQSACLDPMLLHFLNFSRKLLTSSATSGPKGNSYFAKETINSMEDDIKTHRPLVSSGSSDKVVIVGSRIRQDHPIDYEETSCPNRSHRAVPLFKGQSVTSFNKICNNEEPKDGKKLGNELYQDIDLGGESAKGNSFPSVEVSAFKRQRESPHDEFTKNTLSSSVKVSPSKKLEKRTRSHDTSGSRSVYFYFICVDNLEKNLSPFDMSEFLFQKTSVSCQAFVFPSLSVEPHTRGAIFVKNSGMADKIYDFLCNPSHFVVSSKGRPWVVGDKKKCCGRTIEAHMPRYEDSILNHRKNISEALKLMHKGTVEYEKCKKLVALSLEFQEHLEHLLKRLATEMRIIQQWHTS